MCHVSRPKRRKNHAFCVNFGYKSREISLISVDFPHPFGPTIAKCSPCPTVSVTSCRTTLSPRWTVTFCNSIRGGLCIEPGPPPPPALPPNRPTPPPGRRHARPFRRPLPRPAPPKRLPTPRHG